MERRSEEDKKKMDVDNEDTPPCKADRKLDAMSMSPALSEAVSSDSETLPSLKLDM